VKALVTGAGGLVGSAACKRLLDAGVIVVGIENNMRKEFFGNEGSTFKTLNSIYDHPSNNFINYDIDLRDKAQVEVAIKSTKPDAIIHTAAQPSHDWAAKEPHVDFGVNAIGTLNLLEAVREYCIDSPFCHISTSKVYGDWPNYLPLEAQESRYDLPDDHPYYNGIKTSMSVDQCLHSLFGVSKLSGDLLVQEYGRYFHMPTISLRPGCVTGPNHSSVELHGFLSYLMKCCITAKPYTVYGYDGLQVRCNIHANDLVDACWEHIYAPGGGGMAYNIGGGRKSACSMLEAIQLCEDITDRKMNYEIVDEARIGDHKWWISDNSEFQFVYEDWEPKWTVREILEDIYNGLQ
jgi:CDP-paratose 2-epimerase